MKRSQALWLLLAAVVAYYGSIYCMELSAAMYPMLVAWFGGRPLPSVSAWARDASHFVATNGTWVAGLLVALAALSFWLNRKTSAADDGAVALLNAIGYYAARGVLIGLVGLVILQAHGMLVIFLNVDREIRKELGKPVPELESKGR